jgi:hypothetical protein
MELNKQTATDELRDMITQIRYMRIFAGLSETEQTKLLEAREAIKAALETIQAGR